MIVLVLTVVVMIILTAVAITSISNGGIFNKANVATFKTMVASMKEEFVAYNSNELLTQLNGYYNIGEYNSKFLGADETSLTYKGVAIPNKNITDVLKSIKGTSYVSSFTISQGEIIYTGYDENLSAVASEILYNRSDVTTVSTTGETSVTVVNASDEYLKDYTIYGKSEQDGTPTPTEPIPAYSLGERTRNLFNSNVFTAYDSYGITIDYLSDEDCFVLNGTTTANVSTSKKYINIPINNGSTFTMSNKYISGTVENPGVACVTFFGANDEPNISHNWLNATLQNSDAISTSVCNCGYITAFWFYILAGVTFNNYKIKIQLEEGTAATNYIPYNAIEVQSRGKNLATINEIEAGTLQYGSMNVPSLVSDFNSLPVGTTVKFSYDATCNGTLGANAGKVYMVFSDGSAEGAYNIFTKTNKIASQILIYGGKEIDSTYNKFSNIQMEEGTAETPFEPYQEPQTTVIDLTGHEPLRKIGDVADYIDYKNSRIVRNIGKYVVTGEENISDGFNTNMYSIWLSPTYNAVAEALCECTHYIGGIRDNTLYNQRYNSCFVEQRGNIIYISLGKNSLATVTEFRTWLQNNPVTVYYQLAEPIPEAIDLPQIPVYQNGSITVNGASNVSVVYAQTK